MIRPVDILGSVGIHALIIGAISSVLIVVRPKPAAEEEPYFFELVEESSEGAAEPLPDFPAEQPEAEPEDEPVEVEFEPPVDSFDDEPVEDELNEDGETHASGFVPATAHEEAEPPSPVSVAEEPPAPTVAAGGEATHAKVVSDPQARSQISPVYPRRARRKGIEGSVTVELDVDEKGATQAAVVCASSGNDDLDRSALEAVRRAAFLPATEDGVAVSGKVRLTFEFRLREGNGRR